MDIGLGPAATTLESRFTELDTPVLLSGVQALLRVLLEQSRLDRLSGHNTAGLVSGYRGSPLGGVDQEMWRRARLLSEAGIRFQPGLNEDLAVTMLWGTQQLDAFPGKKVDGVFGLWYGKGMGVERSGDPLHCANMMGTAPLGGILAVAGDDHGAHSSTYPHQTEFLFQQAFIPVLAPAGVADVLDFGLAGFALSRFAGIWVALKTTAEVAEQHATVMVPSSRDFIRPDITLPPHGLNYDRALHFPRDRALLEARMLEERLPAVAAWARANGLDRVVFGRADAPVGIVTVGKAHTDLLHALNMLGLAEAPELAIYKIGLSWPLEIEGLRRFAASRRVLFVVEEKRSFVEAQIRDALYNMPASERPAVVGKTDEAGAPLLPPVMELSPEIVAERLARVLRGAGIAVNGPPELPQPERPAGLLARVPAFCAGCPHGTSTQLPTGSFGTAGIGCHFMALDSGDQTRTFTHMGGEGATWVGLAPFTEVPHMFVNMGDGTYQHSGILAIRQAIAAGARMTFKILYNDAVAMTGGQPAEGAPTAAAMASQVAAEGVQHIAIVADEAERLPHQHKLPAGTLRLIREELDDVQRRFREFDGVSVIIYDQVCATEKRRRRKRGDMPQATRSVVINEAVCENCGDCSAQSDCIAIEPVETELGRKRRINPTSCNVDLSCLKGFCPSFVTVDGPPRARAADEHWQEQEQELAANLPEPTLPPIDGAWRGLFAGIGGGGVVTTGAIVGMAGRLDGRHVTTLDFTGLAQKNGTVVSHVQIGEPERLDVVRIPIASADMMLAADLAVGAGPGVLERCRRDAAVIGNLDLATTAHFKRDAWLKIDAGLHRRTVERATSAARSTYMHAAMLAERLFGHAQAMNTMMLGLAWQRGLVPVSREALLRAIELNGAAVKLNHRAFLWGRILAARPELVGQILAGGETAAQSASDPASDLDTMIDNRAKVLMAYQSRRLAARYRRLVHEVKEREVAVFGKPGRLSLAAAEGWFRVLSPKDEYEVARLHAAAKYGAKPVFYMAPPVITSTDHATGRRRKVAIPGWLALPLFHVLRHGKVLRGTRLDPFGYQEDRKAERAMIDAYAEDVRQVLTTLSPETLDTAVELAQIPDKVRGFGPIKLGAWDRLQERRQHLRQRLTGPTPSPAVAAE